MTSAHAVDHLAQSLLDAADQARHHPRPVIDHQPLTVDQGADIQRAQLALRQARGEQVIGVKLGLTTHAQRAEAGVDYSSVGYLTDTMIVTDTIHCGTSVQPKVEPEMVAVFDSTVDDPDMSDEDIINAIGGLHAGIEIVDPRYETAHFILADALADNSSARGAAWREHGLRPDQFDPATETVAFDVGDFPTLFGEGSRVLGNPLHVVVDVVRQRLAQSLATPAGFIIFTGNLVERALPISPGDRVVARFAQLGTIELGVSD